MSINYSFRLLLMAGRDVCGQPRGVRNGLASGFELGVTSYAWSLGTRNQSLSATMSKAVVFSLRRGCFAELSRCLLQ